MYGRGLLFILKNEISKRKNNMGKRELIIDSNQAKIQ